MTEGTPAPAPNPAAPTPAAKQEQEAAFTTGDVSSDQYRAMMQEGVNRNLISRDKANADLAANGLQALDAPQQAAPGEASEQQVIDQFNGQGAAMTAYEMPNLAPPGEKLSQEAMAGDKLMREALSGAHVPREIGNSILREADRVSARYTKMSAPEREAYAIAQRALLAKQWGNQTEAKLKLGNQLLRELEGRHKGIADLMHRSGITTSALGVSMIVGHAERLAARQR